MGRTLLILAGLFLMMPGATTEAAKPPAPTPSTFNWVSPIDPVNPPINAQPQDGQTWLDTSRVPDEGWFTLWVWFDAAGGWTNQPPEARLANPLFGYGTTLVIHNDGSLHIAGVPTTDPHVNGQIWNNGGVLTVSTG